MVKRNCQYFDATAIKYQHFVNSEVRSEDEKYLEVRSEIEIFRHRNLIRYMAKIFGATIGEANIF